MNKKQIKPNRPIPGIYLLKQKIPNSENLDRRCRRDWRKREFVEPGEFMIEDISFHFWTEAELAAEKYDRIFRLQLIGHFSGLSDAVNSNEELFWKVYERLERAPKTPRRVLIMKDSLLPRNAEEVLDKLFELGKISIDDVQEAADKVLRDWEERESS